MIKRTSLSASQWITRPALAGALLMSFMLTILGVCMVGCGGRTGAKRIALSPDWQKGSHEVRTSDGRLLGMSEHAFRFIREQEQSDPADSYVCEWRCTFTNAGGEYGGPLIYSLLDKAGQEIACDSAFVDGVRPENGVTVSGMFPLGLEQASTVREARWRFTCGGRDMPLQCVTPGERGGTNQSR